MAKYETFLGSDAQKLKKHQETVQVVIQKMIDSGVADPWETRARLDWESVTSQTLERLKKQQF
eukprot:1775434-Pyramimonas_sp.AAC.1